MFVRDAWTNNLMPRPNSWLGDAATVARDQVLLRQLHGLALALYQAQQDVLRAQARNDSAYVAARLQDVQRLRGMFQVTAQEFRGNDPEALSGIDQFILTTGTWLEGALHALPGAIAAVPTAMVQAMGKIAGTAGVAVLGGLLPWVLVGGLVLWAVTRAERSRTYRRFVA